MPSVIIGLPVGAFVIRRMNHETFRRICMSFDAWVVGFGLSRVLMELNSLPAPAGYIALAVAGSIDLWLLFRFFQGLSEREEQAAERAESVVST